MLEVSPPRNKGKNVSSLRENSSLPRHLPGYPRGEQTHDWNQPFVKTQWGHRTWRDLEEGLVGSYPQGHSYFVLICFCFGGFCLFGFGPGIQNRKSDLLRY